ncbi:MAG: SUMF1/EgtB/PvdO family nonheme iron enzyme, partial [Anaerolineales bacterium]
MRTQRWHRGTKLPSVLFILSIILAGCATLTPVVPDEVQILEAQTEVETPGGLMYVEDSTGLSHPVLVFDYQIQSRLVECEPVAESDYPLAPAGVDWYQAQAYCSYLGGRLPTEAELVRATGGDEDCSDSGGELISQEGFGEWVYDWDDPDYYNNSLVTNPFGPMYGDIKVAMGLDLNAASEAMGKYWVKLDEMELDHIKLEEIKLE